jgi:hypothetical protein
MLLIFTTISTTEAIKLDIGRSLISLDSSQDTFATQKLVSDMPI